MRTLGAEDDDDARLRGLGKGVAAAANLLSWGGPATPFEEKEKNVRPAKLPDMSPGKYRDGFHPSIHPLVNCVELAGYFWI